MNYITISEGEKNLVLTLRCCLGERDSLQLENILYNNGDYSIIS